MEAGHDPSSRLAGAARLQLCSGRVRRRLLSLPLVAAEASGLFWLVDRVSAAPDSRRLQTPGCGFPWLHASAPAAPDRKLCEPIPADEFASPLGCVFLFRPPSRCTSVHAALKLSSPIEFLRPSGCARLAALPSICEVPGGRLRVNERFRIRDHQRRTYLARFSSPLTLSQVHPSLPCNMVSLPTWMLGGQPHNGTPPTLPHRPARWQGLRRETKGRTRGPRVLSSKAPV